jgi:F420-dependent oxidoreductase-like protein
MIEIAIMIEGQNGLNWDKWKRIATTVEAAGYKGLYRSDHFTNANPPDQDSLECWTSLTWLASHTRRIEFGPMVSPVSFRHPTFLARMAVSVDDLSGGRLTLGIGAGWQEREHTNFGWDLLDKKDRFNRFEEGLEVISGLLHSDSRVSYSGDYYHLKDAIVLPRPSRTGGPPILVGGCGEKRTIPLTARFAMEWNAPFITAGEFTRLNSLLDQHLQALGRPATEIRRSLTAGCVFGNNTAEVERKVNLRTRGQRTVYDLRQRGLVVGTADEIVDQCRVLEGAGVQRLMLQWLDLDDTAGLVAMAEGILGSLS